MDRERRFIDAQFRAKDQIVVLDAPSPQNSGSYVVAEVRADRLVLDGTVKLKSESGIADTKVQVGSVAAVFWLFAAICVLSFLFGWKIMPETKGRTLEEIGEHWEKAAR